MLSQDNSVRYKLDLLQPSTQKFSVTVNWNPEHLDQTIIMPLWTPGSYTIRDYVQYLHKFKVIQNGQEIEADRTATNEWKVKLITLDSIEVKYEIEAHQNTVRTCYIDSKFASICSAAAFVQILEKKDQCHLISVDKPKDWVLHTPLIFDKYYRAANYDELVDSPFLSGNSEVYNFIIKGYNHQLIVFGNEIYKLPSSIYDDIIAICNSTCDLLNMPPPSENRYQFYLQLLDKGYGGLEHDNCCVLEYSWKQIYDSNGYRKLLQLIGHEYLHQWNIRRLRPHVFLQYNYSEPVLSNCLWFAEGVTSYFDLTLPYISGISSEADLRADLSKEIDKYLKTPARYHHSLLDSSKEAWVKLYRQNPASFNYQISYYLLGTLVSLCLDIRLRSFNSSLAEVLRKLWDKFSSPGNGYTLSDILKLVGEVDIRLSDELSEWLKVPNSLELESHLSLLGYTLIHEECEEFDLGLSLKESQNSFYVKSIHEEGSASFSDLAINDEIISIGQIRITSLKDLNSYFIKYNQAEIIYSRNGIINKTNIINKSVKSGDWKILPNLESTSSALQLRNRWLTFV